MKKDKVKRGAKPPDKILFYLHGTSALLAAPGPTLMRPLLAGGAHFFSSRESRTSALSRPYLSDLKQSCLSSPS